MVIREGSVDGARADDEEEKQDWKWKTETIVKVESLRLDGEERKGFDNNNIGGVMI